MSMWRNIADWFDAIEETIAAVGRIEAVVDRIENRQQTQMEVFMAQADQVNMKLDELDQKTNEAADRLRQIIAAIQPGMSQAEVDAIVARIGTEADRLGTWGQSASDPIP